MEKLLFFKIYLIYLFLAVLGLHCCVWAFSSCGGGATLGYGCTGFLLQWLLCCRAQALGVWASVVAARGLSSRGSWVLEHRLSSCGAWA